MGGRDRAAKHREILTEHIDLTPVDRAPARNHTVTGRLLLLHAEIGAAMGDEHVELFKAVFVEQELHPLTCRQFATAVLRIDPLLAASQTCSGAAVLQLGQNILHGAVPFSEFCRPYREFVPGQSRFPQICKTFAPADLKTANLLIGLSTRRRNVSDPGNKAHCTEFLSILAQGWCPLKF